MAVLWVVAPCGLVEVYQRFSNYIVGEAVKEIFKWYYIIKVTEL